VEEQAQTGETQTVHGHQTHGETGKLRLMALQMDRDGLVFFKPVDSPTFTR
jgi:hypothetical protein